MSETLEGKTLEELSVVNFPRNVDEKEAYRVLEHVSADLGYDIGGGSFGGFFSIKAGNLKVKYEADINGSISSKDFSRSATFSFSREVIEDGSAFSGMRFFTTPGYTLEDHDNGEVETWKEIKESVERYFEAETAQGRLL